MSVVGHWPGLNRGLLSLAWCAALTACAGAEFQLPAISDADISRAALTVDSTAASLPTYERSDAEYRVLLEQVADRLRAGAPALCQYAKADSCSFTIEYSEASEVNAYASDNDRIVVYRGLLQYLQTEDEIAAVVGHEFGHHLARHLEEKRQNAMIGAAISGILVGGLMAASGYQAPAYDPNAAQRVMSESMQLGAQVGALSYSKEQEREADLLSGYLLARAHYDLRQAGHVWTVLARLSDKTKASLFDTHPAGPERVAAWEKTIADVEGSPDQLPHWKS